MGAQLRVVLDQVGTMIGPDEPEAARELTGALIATAPLGCTVSSIVPAGDDVRIPGLTASQRLRSPRAGLARAWSLGWVGRVGGGMIHAPTLMAPLVRHDREFANDQTVVTLWDLRPWDAPGTLPASTVAWHRAMLRRAARYADAVIVPSHAMAERVTELARLGDRIRVIAGAAPAGFSEGPDAVARRGALGLPDDYLVVTGVDAEYAPGLRAAARVGVSAVVLDPAVDEETLRAAVQSAGLPAERLHALKCLPAADRAAVLAGAQVCVAGGAGHQWPWRVVEAMALGVPVVAAASEVHRDVIADGGLVVSESEIDEAALAATGSDAARLRVLAGDRARAFSWLSAAERVWALHADL